MKSLFNSKSDWTPSCPEKKKRHPHPHPHPHQNGKKQVKSRQPHIHTKNPKISKIERHIPNKKLFFGTDANLTSN